MPPKKVTQLSADDMRSMKEKKFAANIAKKEAKAAAAAEAIEAKKKEEWRKVRFISQQLFQRILFSG